MNLPCSRVAILLRVKGFCDLAAYVTIGGTALMHGTAKNNSLIRWAEDKFI